MCTMMAVGVHPLSYTVYKLAIGVIKYTSDRFAAFPRLLADS